MTRRMHESCGPSIGASQRLWIQVSNPDSNLFIFFVLGLIPSRLSSSIFIVSSMFSRDSGTITTVISEKQTTSCMDNDLVKKWGKA